ncbi:MAG: Sulfur oxidation protein SoxC [uncultured Rubrobacteraceae bacterium]|uniref:Sulfur oxidation protein SoxC n=1 Tax=uncultured Rubrobacteraceae bacterium TaxID=349277 RepID=A0A6J4NG02_9ACTN|nr:MAG: Sulfur oxidation protein SoxC [uncultured Rubrobacteraceae bacterium]
MPNRVTESAEFTREEMLQAQRCHSMHAEGLRYPITPLGMHYLLVHYDIPRLDPETYELEVGGLVQEPLRLSLENIRARPKVTEAVMMECAGTGRSHASPRTVFVPWFGGAIGCAEWTGTPLWPILEEAGLLEDAVEVLFTGYDRGVEQGVEQDFERSLSLGEAQREGVVLAYEVNGVPLPPQHGAPLRLVVPGWYGMASVKWLKRLEVIGEPFDGFQQGNQYRYKRSADEKGEPVTRQRPQAMMAPPGIPSQLGRTRYVESGQKVRIEGRAWSGFGAVERVEFSADGGRSWEETELGGRVGRFGWFGWSHEWEAHASGEYELSCRATDAAGNAQPPDAGEVWNHGTYGINAVQRVPVVIREGGEHEHQN